MKAKIILIAAGVVLLAVPLPARAELITIAIEAVVDSVEDNGNYLDGQIDVCDIITGYYTYESTTQDSSPLPDYGRYVYDSSPYGIFLSVGGFDFQTDLSNVEFIIGIANDNQGIDAYGFISHRNSPLSNGTTVDTISWWLQDNTCTALSNDSLPEIPPDLTDWQFNHLRLEGDRAFLIDARVISAELVPEPATILLFVMGGLALRKRS